MQKSVNFLAPTAMLKIYIGIQLMFFETSDFSPYRNINSSKGEAFRVLCNSIFKKRCKLDEHVDTQEFQGTLKN